MGWAFGVNNEGREVGYSVKAKCDAEGCDTAIDRGLAYCCGGMHDGGQFGCGKYFCYSHLIGYGLCDACADNATCPQCEGGGICLDDPAAECPRCEGMGDLPLELA